MKTLRWKSIYYPCGEWQVSFTDPEELGHSHERFQEKPFGNFKARLHPEDAPVLVIMAEKEGGGGHGDPRFFAETPLILLECNLQEIKVDWKNSFLEVKY